MSDTNPFSSWFANGHAVVDIGGGDTPLPWYLQPSAPPPPPPPPAPAVNPFDSWFAPAPSPPPAPVSAPAPSTGGYTNQQIQQYTNNILEGGGSWNDVLKAANQFGVGLDQLAAAGGMTGSQGAQYLQNQGADLNYLYGTVPSPAPSPVPTAPAPVSGGTPSWLTAFQNANPQELIDQGSVRVGNQWVTPIYGQGTYNGMDNYTPGAITGYRVYDHDPNAVDGKASAYNGTQYQEYDANGQNGKTGTWSGLSDNNELTGIAAVLAAPFLVGGLQGLGMLPGAGSGAVGGAGGFIGEGALSGIPAWDAAGGLGGLGSTSMGAGAAGLGAEMTVPTAAELGSSFATDFAPYLTGETAAGTGAGIFNAAQDSQLANSTLGLSPYTGSVPSAVDLGSLGGTVSTGAVGGSFTPTVPGVFNAAKDSQLYNATVGDSNALGGYQTPGATPSTVTLSNGGPGGTSITGSTIGPSITPSPTTTAPAPAPKPSTTPVPKTGTGGGGQGGGGGGLGSLGSIIDLITGAVDYNRQQNAAKDMLDYLKGRQSLNDNLYNPGTPEYNALWDQMSRKDAAAGRNSQYGPRSVDMAAKIAQIKADANTKMTTGIGALYAAALNQNASAPAGLAAALNSGGASGASSWINSLSSLFGGSSALTDLGGGINIGYDNNGNPIVGGSANNSGGELTNDEIDQLINGF